MAFPDRTLWVTRYMQLYIVCCQFGGTGVQGAQQNDLISQAALLPPTSLASYKMIPSDCLATIASYKMIPSNSHASLASYKMIPSVCLATLASYKMIPSNCHATLASYKMIPSVRLLCHFS